MKKQILHLGKVLTKAEQKQIKGGKIPTGTLCYSPDIMPGPNCILPAYYDSDQGLCCVDV
ncbi:MAG: hypothetical protein GQ564_16600 [Bacteroidales bacterium]|nr:hypothetical protein [Bacteroidales bacterium]